MVLEGGGNKPVAALFYRDLRIAPAGSMDTGFRKVRDVFLEEMDKRFANQSILRHLQWLQLDTWPLAPSDVNIFATDDLKALWCHWSRRLPMFTWDQVQTMEAISSMVFIFQNCIF